MIWDGSLIIDVGREFGADPGAENLGVRGVTGVDMPDADGSSAMKRTR